MSILFPPFDVPLRIKGLKNFRQILEVSDITLLSENLTFPDSIVMELYDNCLLHIIHINENQEISFIAIQESSICEAFYTFFRSLNTTEYSLSQDEQRIIISREIRKLEGSVSQNRFTPPRPSENLIFWHNFSPFLSFVYH